MEQSKKFFWTMCFISVICALGLSAVTMLQKPSPMPAAFLVINAVSLIVNIVCFVIDVIDIKK